MLVPLFHATALAVDAFSLWYDQQYLDLPSANKEKTDKMPLKGRLMFLTIWSLILQTVYFSIALLNDLLGSNEAAPRKAPIIRKLKDIAFSLAFPVGIYVTTTFWGIYHFDKELIFPEHIAKVFPVWLNHTMHSTVTAFLIVELLLTKRTYPSRKVGLTIALTFNVAYITWMHVLFDRLGMWPYPIFHVLNLPMRVVFLSVAMLLGISFYLLGEKLNSFVSPISKKKKSEPKKKRK